MSMNRHSHPQYSIARRSRLPQAPSPYGWILEGARPIPEEWKEKRRPYDPYREKLREEYKQIIEEEKQKAAQEAQRKIEEEKRRQQMILEAQKQAEIARWLWQSRTAFWGKLEAEESEARQEFQSQIEKKKENIIHEFERRLSLEAFRLLRAGAKRPYVEAWKQSQRAKFLRRLQSWEKMQKSLFERQIKMEKKEAIRQFEIKLMKKLPEVEQKLSSQIESALSAWEESAKQQLELSIEEWEKQAWQKFEETLTKLPKRAEIDREYSRIIEDVQRQIMPFGMSPETLKEVHEKGMAGMIMESKEAPKPIRELIAGIIGSIENFSYFPYSIIGVKTPPPPPNPLTEGSAEYKIAFAFTDIFLSSVIWEIGPSKIGGWIKQTETYQKIARTIKFSKAYKFYYERFKIPVQAWYTTKVRMPAEKWMIKHWKWYRSRIAKTLAPELVDIPEFSYPTPTALFKQEIAWQIAESPKSTALLITKYTGKPEKMLPDWVSEHWIKKVTVTGGTTQLLSPEQTVKPVVEPLTKIFIPSIQPTTKETTSLLKPLIGAFVIKAAFKPRIFQELTPSLKAIETEFAKIENLTQQFSIPKISIKLKTKALALQETKFKTQTILGKFSIPEIKAPSIPKVKIPSRPFKIKSKRKKGKLSPLLYGWGWMFSPVMEPQELMKLMFGGKKKK